MAQKMLRDCRALLIWTVDLKGAFMRKLSALHTVVMFLMHQQTAIGQRISVDQANIVGAPDEGKLHVRCDEGSKGNRVMVGLSGTLARKGRSG